MPSVQTIRVLWHVTNFLNLFSGQLWTLNGVNGSTLTNKAGLWKSKDKWNLIPLEKDILNSNDTKGELDTFHSDRIHNSQVVERQISVI